MHTEIVDAVITWVDGHDKIHQDKLAKTLADMGIERPEVAAATRFNQCGEIEYCIKSVFRFAPWIRTIYIVTDAQIPPILQAFAGTPFENRIKRVDHRDIFAGFEAYLPTFNSISIESVLWRIDGLSERFIYFNDDCILTRPVAYDDFFRDNQLVLRGKWKITSDWKLYDVYHRLLKQCGKQRDPVVHRMVQENSAKLAGVRGWFFHLPHMPFPLRKSTFERYFSEHPEILKKNVSYPFRDLQQFLPVSLAHHLEIKQHTAVIDNTLKMVGISANRYTSKRVKKKLLCAENDSRVSFICVQCMDMASPEVQDFLLKWLDHRI